LIALIDLTGKKGDDSAWKPKLGLDLQGGTRITLQAKASSGKVTSEKLRQARNIIDQRVNGTGVTEAEVTTQGGDQVIIEIPGQKKGNIVDEVGKTAQLRFRLVWSGNLTSATAPADAKTAAAEQKAIDAVDWSKLTLDQLLKAETVGLDTLPAEYADAVA